MRIPFGLLLAAAASAGTAGAASAGADGCCAGTPIAEIVHANALSPYIVPQSGFALDPSDSGNPYYVVKQGDHGFAAVVYPRGPGWKDGSAVPDYPYIVSHGFGTRYAYRAFRVIAARRCRAAPHARVVRLPHDD